MSEQLRIVSLIASATEIVCALGLRDRLVGRSHECDYPKSVVDLPQCTSPKFSTEGTSAEIDARVKQILEQALSVYQVDSSLLDQLSPTHIITQSQCEVCAVSMKDVEEAVCSLIGSKPAIIELKPDSLSDVWNDIKKVAACLSKADAGGLLVDVADFLVDDLRERLLSVSRRAHPQGAATFPRIRLAFIEWIDPLMAGGNWMPELVEIAAAENVFGQAGKHAPPIQFSDLLQADPDVIVVAPCGFGVQRTLSDMHILSDRPEWQQLKAVKSNAVFVADGNQFFNRPGPRLVDSAEMLVEIIDSYLGAQKSSIWWLRLSNPVQSGSAAIKTR